MHPHYKRDFTKLFCAFEYCQVILGMKKLVLMNLFYFWCENCYFPVFSSFLFLTSKSSKMIHDRIWLPLSNDFVSTVIKEGVWNSLYKMKNVVRFFLFLGLINFALAIHGIDHPEAEDPCKGRIELLTESGERTGWK